MVPTHRHADGGYYRYLGPQKAKGDEPDSVWIDGVAYRNVEGMMFWTTEKRWAERFEELSVEQVAESDVVLTNDEDELIGSFVFQVHEASDVRFMLIKAKPQPNSRITDEQFSHIKRVLMAMADMVTQDLHVRAHDFPDLIGDVAAFHAKFGQEYTGKPRMLPQDLHEFRVKFHDEESSEYNDEYVNLCTAVVEKDRRDIIGSLEKQLDALVDLVWVALGTADLQFGRDRFHEAWRRVVKANMGKIAKAHTTDGDGSVDSGREAKYDIVKPAGWLPPDHRDLVEDNAIFDEWNAPELPAPDTEFMGTAQDAGSYSDTRAV